MWSTRERCPHVHRLPAPRLRATPPSADEAAVAAAQQNVAAQENLLRQLRQNRNYALVVAPFDGVITQRNVDVGSLVQGDVIGGAFMFEIQQKDVIRVWVYAPHDAAFGVTPGVDAVVRVPEFPERRAYS